MYFEPIKTRHCKNGLLTAKQLGKIGEIFSRFFVTENFLEGHKSIFDSMHSFGRGGCFPFWGVYLFLWFCFVFLGGAGFFCCKGAKMLIRVCGLFCPKSLSSNASLSGFFLLFFWFFLFPFCFPQLSFLLSQSFLLLFLAFFFLLLNFISFKSLPQTSPFFNLNGFLLSCLFSCLCVLFICS